MQQTPGRTADTVEQMELGSTRRTPLTELLELPFRIEPGQSEKWVIGRKRLDPVHVEALASGWSSLWTLTGSMKQRRAEVVPTGESEPPAAGWRLVPKREKFSRHLPLLAAGWVFAATDPYLGVNQEAASVAMFALSVWILLKWTEVIGKAKFSRAVWQRRLTLCCLLVAVFGGFAVEEQISTAGDMSLPVWMHVVRTALLVGGFFVARAKLGDWWLAGRRWTNRKLVEPFARRVDPLQAVFDAVGKNLASELPRFTQSAAVPSSPLPASAPALKAKPEPEAAHVYASGATTSGAGRGQRPEDEPGRPSQPGESTSQAAAPR